MFLVAFLGVLAIATALPWEEELLARQAMFNPDLFEGDITGIDKDTDRNAIVNPAQLWTNGVVPYVIDASLSSYRDLILSAMKSYHDNTCIRFVPRTNQANYMLLRPVSGCSSPVGMHGGQQVVSLVQGCYIRQTIEHELGHGIGFWHEQSRSDRDDYLTIYWDNILDKNKFNFDKLNPWMNNFLGEEFDYDSVMLYDNYAFSKRPGVDKTMVAKNGQPLVPVWDKPGLSASDIRRVNKLYECNGEVRPDPADPPDWTCDFENDICDMEQLTQGKQWSWAEVDIAGKKTNVMIIQGEENHNAGLMTPWLEIGRARKNGCVHLDTYMNGKDVYGMDIVLYDGVNAAVTLKRHTTKSTQWQHLEIKADSPRDTLSVAFYGYTTGADSIIAIDNIRLSVKPCSS